LEKLELNKKHFFILTLFFSLVFCCNIFLKYQDYKELKKSNYQNATLQVITQYNKRTKRGKYYTLLKLQFNNGIKFFGISWHRNLQNLQNEIISCKINTKKLSFYKYLKGFFTSVYHIKKVSKKSYFLKDKISNFISFQHKNNITKELFCALFLGQRISKVLRKKIQLLGVSHLVAISGFHLGVISFLIFLILTPIYKFFQDKFFPYRNRMLDLIILSSFCLFLYLYLVGFIPSLVRAFTMLIIGYIFYIRYIKILSFETLFLTIMILLAFYPFFLFSISFWFSVVGVFYIFLFLYYFKDLKPWKIFILINFWVYILMQPIVHYIFPTFALSQLLSPILSMIFVLFYPLELFLHIIKEGGLLDSMVLKLLDFHTIAVSAKTPLWFLLTYITTSLLSIYKKIFLYLLILQSLLFLTYLILPLIA